MFIAFDLLFLNGKDLRPLPLIERKIALRNLLPRRKRSPILYLDHVQGDGRLLFEQIVAVDLEGIVCKRKDWPYKVTGETFPPLDQDQQFPLQPIEGREESFEQLVGSTSTVSRFYVN